MNGDGWPPMPASAVGGASRPHTGAGAFGASALYRHAPGRANGWLPDKAWIDLIQLADLNHDKAVRRSANGSSRLANADGSASGRGGPGRAGPTSSDADGWRSPPRVDGSLRLPTSGRRL
jgi:hypothetical protein